MSIAPEIPDDISDAGEGKARDTPLLVRHLAVAPFTYALAVPIALLDGAVSLYQAVSFRLLGIEQVERSRYVVFTRQGLPYLNGLQKLNCAYCSYANGVIAYAREIASRTEQYWCPIKHEQRPPAPHERYDAFLPYGDATRADERMEALREQIVTVRPSRTQPAAPSAPAPRTSG